MVMAKRKKGAAQRRGTKQAKKRTAGTSKSTGAHDDAEYFSVVGSKGASEAQPGSTESGTSATSTSSRGTRSTRVHGASVGASGVESRGNVLAQEVDELGWSTDAVETPEGEVGVDRNTSASAMHHARASGTPGRAMAMHHGGYTAVAGAKRGPERDKPVGNGDKHAKTRFQWVKRSSSSASEGCDARSGCCGGHGGGGHGATVTGSTSPDGADDTDDGNAHGGLSNAFLKKQKRRALSLRSWQMWGMAVLLVGVLALGVAKDRYDPVVADVEEWLWELGQLTLDASPGEIRRAYLARARAEHPDRGGSHEAFVRLQTMYEHVISHVEARDAAIAQAAAAGRGSTTGEHAGTSQGKKSKRFAEERLKEQQERYRVVRSLDGVTGTPFSWGAVAVVLSFVGYKTMRIISRGKKARNAAIRCVNDAQKHGQYEYELGQMLQRLQLPQTMEARVEVCKSFGFSEQMARACLFSKEPAKAFHAVMRAGQQSAVPVKIDPAKGKEQQMERLQQHLRMQHAEASAGGASGAGHVAASTKGVA